MARDKSLSADNLFALVRAEFEQVPDRRAENAKVSLPDALMSGLAMFSLKDTSLLAFEERKGVDSNLKSMYRIEKAPCDTQMRTILDDVEPVQIRPVFKRVHVNLSDAESYASLSFWKAATWFHWMARATSVQRKSIVPLVNKRSTRRRVK